jgi:hypothetical protein
VYGFEDSEEAVWASNWARGCGELEPTKNCGTYEKLLNVVA